MNPSSHKLLRNPLFSAGLILLVTLFHITIFFLSYKYAVYAVLTVLSLVAASIGFALFEEELSKFFSALASYFLLVFPFFMAYGRFASRSDMASAEGFAMVSIMIVLSAFILLDDLLLGSPFIRLFQLAKKFMMARKSRYLLSLLSIIAYAASVTSLSFILPLYALLVLFGIVLCEVAVTMIGSVNERKKEIFTLATVGLNPDHLSGLFLAESFILGLLGGGIGYAIGIYILLLSLLPITPLEISTGWIVTVIFLSIATAITASILAALKASMLATPSLLKRWWREAPPIVGWPPMWTFQIPVRVTEKNTERFIDHFHGYARMLEKFSYGSMERAEEVQVVKPNVLNEEKTAKLKFRYIFNEIGSPMIITDNELTVFRNPNTKEISVEFTIKVTKYQGTLDIYDCLERMASTYRRLALQWTLKNKRIGNPIKPYVFPLLL